MTACFLSLLNHQQGLEKILFPIPQASLSPANIWLEEWGQAAGMCAVEIFRRLSSLFILPFLP